MKTPVTDWPWPPIKTEDCKRIQGGSHTACVFCAPYQFPMNPLREDGTRADEMPESVRRAMRQARAS